ncbi:MAG: AAA family ATPase [Burkholderiales bacterium]|nr:MAG: AAA family ATPase [Burkholderiales bacterium]
MPALNTPPNAPFKRSDFLRLLLVSPFYWMMLLLIVEAGLAAATTALIIQASHDVSQQEFLITDFVWIVAAQSASYIVGASSWIFAERAGFGAYGRYMSRFAKDNRRQTALLGDREQREQVEPFLTNETFHTLFELIYELEADFKLFFSLLFNTIVLGYAIDAGLPIVYAFVFVSLLILQWFVRKPVAAAYLAQQRETNRMTAHTYTAWDNITTGNRYNYRLWNGGFKERLRGALKAQIRAIMARETIATVSGIFALIVVFSYLAWVAGRNVGDSALLIALAATLPRQIDLSYNVHGLASGWNDLLAVWTRMGGVCAAMRPAPDAQFNQRIHFEGVSLARGSEVLPCSNVDVAAHQVLAQPTGRILVRGGNGMGKSSLLVALKARFGSEAFYWPTSDKLSFSFLKGQENDDESEENALSSNGFSSGEKQMRSLQEISAKTQAKVYLLDEWDANLDSKNRALAEQIVSGLAARAVVVEISHRDRV